MPAPIELVIFDCDGTLVDSERLAVRAQVRIGAELGWPLTEAEVLDVFIGRSVSSVSVLIAERLGDDAVTQWHQRFRELHDELVDAELTEIAGMGEALAAIAHPKCVASSNGHGQIRYMLKRTGLYDHFGERIYSAADVAHGKPAPDVFLHAAAQMGFRPESCVVIEDSKYGIQAARAAGMRSFGYFGGITPREWLEGPDTVVFDDMRALPGLLAEAAL